MKTKIYKNRQVLQGKTFLVKLNSRPYYFQIKNVSNKEIKIVYHMKFSEINFSIPSTIEGIVKKVILENTSDRVETFDRRIFKSAVKLKKVRIIIDGVRFRLNNITHTYLDLEKVIELDELLESDDESFLGNVKINVLNNLLENPPPVKKIRCAYGDIPYLFDSGGDYMHFKTLRRQKKGAPEKLDEDQKRERIREKREYRENRKKLNKDNSKTHELARHR